MGSSQNPLSPIQHNDPKASQDLFQLRSAAIRLDLIPPTVVVFSFPGEANQDKSLKPWTVQDFQ